MKSISKTLNRYCRRSTRLLAALGMAVIWCCLSAQAATLTWNAGGDGLWDTSSPNWSGDATTFTSDGSEDVIFDDVLGGIITVSPNMDPRTTTIGTSAGNYTFTGGAIAGSGSLTMSGTGTLGLSAVNTYTGKTIVQAGTL